MRTPERQTPPEGGAHQISPARSIDTLIVVERQACLLACSLPCPWATCPMQIGVVLTALIADLLAVTK